METAEATYSPQGELLCRRCSAITDVQKSENRILSNLKYSGYMAFVCAVASWFCNPFLLASVLAVIGALRTIVMLVRHPEYRPRLGGHATALWVVSILAIIVAALPFFAGVLAVSSCDLRAR